jgi:hypothetical protein
MVRDSVNAARRFLVAIADANRQTALTPVPGSAEFEKNPTPRQTNSPQVRITDSGSQNAVRGQLFIRSHNETLSVVAMRVCNPGRSPVGINS